MFISDSLCDDNSIKRIIEQKRKFSIIPKDQEKFIGGLRMKEKPERLPEQQREKMREILKDIKYHFEL